MTGVCKEGEGRDSTVSGCDTPFPVCHSSCDAEESKATEAARAFGCLPLYPCLFVVVFVFVVFVFVVFVH